MFSEKKELEIQERFEEQMRLLGRAGEEIRSGIAAYDDKTAAFLRYFYGHMIVSDAMNVPMETYADYAQHAAFLWEQGAYKDRIPEDIFLNYVAGPRINEENILPCRKLFYQEASYCLEGRGMEEAVLEANYWCASQVTYRSTDDRTLAPLTVYRNGYGRCGEESTFTVSVLRSLGIPARQVYAPRWSHCDDNHAWVEFYSDGEWKYCGACEPEQVSCRGWFTNAASRAMMVHSRRFDHVQQEQEIGLEGMSVVANQLERYAVTREICVKVERGDGTAAEGAALQFEVANYAEYAPIARMRTGADGTARLTTGKGTLRIYAAADGLEAEAVLGADEASGTLTLAKPRMETDKDWTEVEFLAPEDSNPQKEVLSDEQKKLGDEKMAAAVARRMEKMASFYQEEQAQRIEEKYGCSEVNEYLRKAEANFPEVCRFLETDGYEKDRLDMMRVLTLKDFRDVKAEVLEEHLQAAASLREKFPEEVYREALLNPRIEWEPMSAYRKALKEQYADFAERPQELWEKISADTRQVPEHDFEPVVMEPVPCAKSGLGSERSARILYVAACRSLGIPARLEPATGVPEYYRDGAFHSVVKAEAAGTLVLEGDETVQWVYRQNYTVARHLENGWKTLSLEDREWEDGRITAKLPQGRYRVMTANRLPNGDMFIKQRELILAADEVQTVKLELKEAKLSQMLEKVPLPAFSVTTLEGEKVSAAEAADGRKTIWIWLEESKEPTEHILNELYERQEEFSKMDRDIICLVRTKEALTDTTFTRTRSALPGIRVYLADFVDEYDQVSRRMYQDPDRLPLIVVTDEEMYGIYATCGYSVGTGDMLLRICQPQE